MPKTPSFQRDFVVGYHATDRSIANSILSGQVNWLASRGTHWLGDGTYFWEEDPERAWWWGNYVAEQSRSANLEYAVPVRISEVAVIGAVIYLGNCLDLTKDSDLTFVKDTFKLVERTYERSGYKLPRNSGVWHALDSYVIDEACKRHREEFEISVDTVRGIFVSDKQRYKRAYPGAMFPNIVYKVVNVRNVERIVTTFEVEALAD